MPVALRWKRGLWVLLLPALLAGCFQQRGESFQPASNTALPVDSTPIIETIAPDDEAAAPDDPGMEIIVPAPDTSSQALSTPTALPITVFMQPTRPQETPPGQDAADTDITPSAGQFITPVSPLGPVFESPTPPGLQPAAGSGLVTPTALSADGDAAGPALAGSACTYTVRPGDNLYRIAINNDTSLAAMRAANPDLTGDAPILQPGQVLRLPDCTPGGAEDVVAPTPAPPSTGPTVPPVPGQQQVYRVQSGDTLYGIAIRFGTTIAAIQAANNLANPNRLDVGQEIIIPAN